MSFQSSYASKLSLILSFWSRDFELSLSSNFTNRWIPQLTNIVISYSKPSITWSLQYKSPNITIHNDNITLSANTFHYLSSIHDSKILNTNSGFYSYKIKILKHSSQMVFGLTQFKDMKMTVNSGIWYVAISSDVADGLEPLLDCSFCERQR